MIDHACRTKRFFSPLSVATFVLLPVSLAAASFWPDETSAEPAITIAPPIPSSIPTSGRVMGDPAAPVKVIEWGDYQCPYCGAFARDVQPLLVDNYVKTGKVSFEYRDFAFLGPESVLAAEAADCAMDQGKFWQFHNTLFDSQGAENSSAFSVPRLNEMATEMGLNTSQFSQCLTSGSHRQEVIAMRQDGIESGINSTPSLIVNGMKITYRGWDSLQNAIETALQTP